jgi:uncharacterized protein YndB with AHSA1/START domain
MGHEFELRHEAEVRATPEQVWQAIATGPGIDSWFMGRSQVEPREGGAVRTIVGGLTLDSTVTAWEPLRKFAHHSGQAEDGRFIAHEFLIEGRERGSTVLRLVTSGFLPGDDWEAEYDAMTTGGDLYFRTLAAYLTYFAGRTATPITAYGPSVTDWDKTWAALGQALGLTGRPREGDHVRANPSGAPPVDGVVDVDNANCVGVRTSDGLYRFVRGFFQGALVTEHHVFSPSLDRQAAEAAWTAWLTELFA